MFPPISAIFGLLFFASTLPNGIRLIELPADGDSVEITAGYTSGGLRGFASTGSASPFLLRAYAVGATIDFINDPDRTALRVTAPKWAFPMLADQLPGLFKDIPSDAQAGLAGRSLSISDDSDFRTKVEEEIRNALLGPALPNVDYSTDDAFIVISAAAPDSLREALAGIPKRTSGKKRDEQLKRLPAERTLRFKSDLPVGAVIFASPVEGVYYKQWYLMLLLDRLIQRVVPLPLKTTFPLAVSPYYYRLELPVPAGQFPEPVEEKLLQELQRLQYTPANAQDLAAARQAAVAYLDTPRVREWFASNDMLERRQEGMQWIQSMSADDLRVAARDLLIMNRVIATWAPKPVQTSVTAEPLSAAVAVAGRAAGAPADGRIANAQVEVSVIAFPAHDHAAILTPLAERLASGVSLIAGDSNAVYVSGVSLTRFDQEFTAEDLKLFQQYRPDRILVLTPAPSMDRARQLWSAFKGSANGAAAPPKGTVSIGDLPALFILKTLLDLKVIESGWWPAASVRIDANEGSTLRIRATDEKREQILSWIRTIANTPLPEPYFQWLREVALHRFAGDRADVQALTWERDPQHVIQDIATISAQQVQDVARTYF